MLRQLGGWLRSSHSFKECVIAHQSSVAAPKMVGTLKPSAEAADFMLAWSGRGAFPERRSWGGSLPVERREVRMPERVRDKQGENPCHRKPKGS